MNWKELCHILGKYLGCFGLLLCFPLSIALYDQFTGTGLLHHSHWESFLYAIFSSMTLSLLLLYLGRKASKQIGRRESILLVALIWISSAMLAALPFLFSKTLTHPMDAYFEAMSGLTTTGSTMISAETILPIRDPETGAILYSGIEAVSRSILFWRSFLQWIGGMGIVVLFLTILPALGVGGKFLYQIETTGPFKEEVSPRIHNTVSQLWKLYLSFTLIQIVLLLSAEPNLPLFDAICTSLSTISTGGFSIHNESIASYHNSTIEWIIIVFMILGSINFSLYFHIFRMKIYRIYVPDFLLFLATALGGSLIVSFFLIGSDVPLAQVFREGTFQAISVQTTTGFVTANYDLWPISAQLFLLLLMFVGGMSGSTAGGIKTSRFYILYKIVQHRLELLYRPNSVRKLRIGSIDIDDKNALTVLSFFCIVAFFTILGTTILILDHIDPKTALGLIACFMNNVGVAFGVAGPAGSLGFLSNFDKFIGTCWMLFGRLEFYVLLLLFLPSYWKGR